MFRRKFLSLLSASPLAFLVRKSEAVEPKKSRMASGVKIVPAYPAWLDDEIEVEFFDEVTESDYCIIGNSYIRFDGFEFANCALAPWALWGVEAAARARRGDKISAAVLNAWRVVVIDRNGRSYWPMEGQV